MPITRFLTRTAICLTALLVVTMAQGQDGPKASPEKEQQLLGVLRSEAAPGDKAIACKLLAIHGSKSAVPDLAKLLSDPQLASWSRIALEVIPGEEADAALRKAAESLEGKLLVGTLNSIGVRRDGGATELLTKRLQDQDAEVVAAAAVALGRIGSADAAKALRGLLASETAPVRAAAAEGCVLCAERFHIAGEAAEAIEIYDAVRQAKVPKQRVLEATRGAILARQADGLPLLMEQFRSPDKGLFRLALGTAREFPGAAIDKELALELNRATPERAALIVQAMADRQKTVELPAILKVAAEGPKPVRLAAIGALGRVGDASCLMVLLNAANDADKDVAQAAQTTLADLPGTDINAQIVALLPKAEGKQFAQLIVLVGQRRIEATPALLKALDSSDKVVRTAALAALGETVDIKNLNILVGQVVKPTHVDDASVAQLALKTACVRMPDREACAEVLAAAINRAPAATKTTLLEILGEVGGTKALQTLATASKSDDAQLQDVGSRVLGKWNSVEAAPVLLDLAKSAPSEKYQVRALRGYIGLARKFAMPEAERAQMCEQAFGIAKPAEQKLVLDVLKLHPSPVALKLATDAIKVTALKEDATQATLIIAQKLSGKGVDVSQLLGNAGFEKVKLEIVKAEYGSGSTQKDVTSILKKQAGDLPLIALAEGYNATFGGDPLPGSVKQLKVQYRLNGKLGEVTLAEDALIVLPTPK